MKSLVAAGVSLILVACEISRPGNGAPDPAASVESPYPLPSEAPERFSFGAEATEDRISLWDIDVKPDGEGLPEGSGTVTEGQVVYEAHCLVCHGPTGTEGPYHVLAGTAPWEEWPGSRTIGGYWPYATTLYDFIRRAMPQLTPGILTADETYAVVAYLLHLNGVVPDDAVMDAEALPAVMMPARDRFVADDRQGGPEIR